MTAPAGYKIVEFLNEAGRSPFREWLENLDENTQARIQARIFRFESGNLGDAKQVGFGVREARFDFGPGYRLYFGLHERTLIVLLGGGDKKRQNSDIAKAQSAWAEWKETSRDVKKKS